MQISFNASCFSSFEYLVKKTTEALTSLKNTCSLFPPRPRLINTENHLFRPRHSIFLFMFFIYIFIHSICLFYLYRKYYTYLMYLQQNCTRMEDAKEDYVLKWSEFQTNLTSTFDQLRRTEDFVDVTLSVGGRSIKCHKVSCH